MVFYKEQTESVNLNIYSIDGKLIHEQHLELKAGSNEVSLSLHDVNAGIYLLSADMGDQKILKKLIIH